MFYKNSQNCKVQSSLFIPENHRSTESSLQAEWGELHRAKSLCVLILACGPRGSLAALLETGHQLHLPFSNIPFRDAPFFVNGDYVTVAVAPADLVAHLKLMMARPKIWHAFVVNVLVLTPPGGRQVFLHVGAALRVGRVSEVGHARVKRVSVGGLQVVLGLCRQLGDIAIGSLRLHFLLGLVEKGVSPLRDERGLELFVMELQPWIVAVH